MVSTTDSSPRASLFGGPAWWWLITLDAAVEAYLGAKPSVTGALPREVPR
jgi:hypothetical protein